MLVTLLTGEDSRTFTFTYDKAYLIGDNAEPVSLILPLQSEPHTSIDQLTVFANMLSDGEKPQVQSRL